MTTKKLDVVEVRQQADILLANHPKIKSFVAESSPVYHDYKGVEIRLWYESHEDDREIAEGGGTLASGRVRRIKLREAMFLGQLAQQIADSLPGCEVSLESMDEGLFEYSLVYPEEG